MQQKRSMERKRRSVGAGIAAGILLSLVVSIFLAAGLALLVAKEYVGIEKMYYFSLAILFVAVGAGAYAAAKITTKTPALVCGIVAIAYFILLIATNALFMEDGFAGIWSGAISITLGWVCACALCISKPRKSNYKKVRNR